MTIHSEHPFAGGPRDEAKAFRGRLGARVGLLAAGAGRARSGWTVSSLMAVGGEPWRLVVALDPEADVLGPIEDDGRAVLMLLGAGHRQLADVFAGLAPAPGGGFRIGQWEQTVWGPLLVDSGALSGVDTWAGLELEDSRELGWSRLLTFRIAHVEAGPDQAPLHHVRGRYREFPGE